MDNQSQVDIIANKHLGQKGGEGYSDTYDPSLLVRIPRYLNRETYNIQELNLPFVGTDVWNAYEVSTLTEKGLPVSGMMKIICPADSEFHVESKSIKLYLNSFNMSVMGKDTDEVIETIETVVAEDLSKLLEAEVLVKFFSTSKSSPSESINGFVSLGKMINLDTVNFNQYKSDASQLVIDRTFDGQPVRNKYHTDLLRSNCRVTNQPDWGDLYIEIFSSKYPTPESLAKYVVSHRKVNHFHEEVVEMTFMHLLERFQPKELMVAALYTRRGGIDINPIRATHRDLIPKVFTKVDSRLEKTLRQ